MGPLLLEKYSIPYLYINSFRLTTDFSSVSSFLTKFYKYCSTNSRQATSQRKQCLHFKMYSLAWGEGKLRICSCPSQPPLLLLLLFFFCFSKLQILLCFPVKTEIVSFLAHSYMCFPGGSVVKNLAAKQEIRVQSWIGKIH